MIQKHFSSSLASASLPVKHFCNFLCPCLKWDPAKVSSSQQYGIHTDYRERKNCMILKSGIGFLKSKKVPDFFNHGRSYLPKWPEKSVWTWQHCTGQPSWTV